MATRVGFIGLGSMGFPMAQNILKRGFPLSVYNRTKEKGSPLVNEGALWASSPAELASQCDIIVSMVANDPALKEVSEGIFRASKKPSIHISMSTVSPLLSEELEKEHQKHGISFLAAPVSGRPERAKAGTLWIFLAGHPEAKKKAMPILEAMSKQVFDLGDRPHQASLFKLCNNFMILSVVEMIAEATAMLEKEGISAQKAADVWLNSLFNGVIFQTYFPIIAEEKFKDGGFALNLGLKDMRLLQNCADSAEVPMPFLSTLHEKLLTSLHLGREQFDWSAIALLTRELAGLKPILHEKNPH